MCQLLQRVTDTDSQPQVDQPTDQTSIKIKFFYFFWQHDGGLYLRKDEKSASSQGVPLNIIIIINIVTQSKYRKRKEKNVSDLFRNVAAASEVGGKKSTEFRLRKDDDNIVNGVSQQARRWYSADALP